MPRVLFLTIAAVVSLVAPAAAQSPAPEIRQLTWDGSDHLTINVGGDVTYTQGSPARVTVTGDPELVAHLLIKDGLITVDPEFAQRGWRDGRTPWGGVKLTIVAPAVERFVFNASGAFVIRGYSRDRMSLTVNGRATVSVAGVTRAVTCSLNGKGSVDLGGLTTGEARINIPGGGEVAVAALDYVGVNIINGGQVRLLNKPARLDQRIVRGGRVIPAS